MLTTSKHVTFTGSSNIEGLVIENYTAEINGENPEDMRLTSYINDQVAYKKNKEQCRLDRVEFEEKAFALQDEMIKEKKGDE